MLRQRGTETRTTTDRRGSLPICSTPPPSKAPGQSRPAKQQLDHWARVGRAVCMHQTAARRRVEAALAGTLPLDDLNPDERLVANAELDATIGQHAQSTSYGDRLAAEGITTVALDNAGRLVEHHPDGTSAVIG